MGNNRVIEIVVGVFVALGIAALFMLAMKVSNLSNLGADEGYELQARFDNIGGLKVMSPVSVAGVRIGRVASIEFDQNRYEAVVKMIIDPDFNRLPKDTSASIYTAGLLGEQYISLEPGADEVFLHAGDQVKLTQSSLVMEQLIGQFLFDKAAEGTSK
jgi:phospholipid/cholesterol/gamma-HCH transport system substrate-binding protein